MIAIDYRLEAAILRGLAEHHRSRTDDPIDSAAALAACEKAAKAYEDAAIRPVETKRTTVVKQHRRSA